MSKPMPVRRVQANGFWERASWCILSYRPCSLRPARVASNSLPNFPMVGSSTWFPLGHTLGKALNGLRQVGVAYERLEDRQSILVALAAGQLSPLVTQLEAILSGEELHDTQSLFTTEPDLPRLTAFSRVVPLKRFIGMVNSGWLLDLLQEERLTSHFPANRATHDPTRPFAHEALLRGHDAAGTLVPPGRLFDAARDAGMLFPTESPRPPHHNVPRRRDTDSTDVSSSTSTRPRSTTEPSVSAPPSPRSMPPACA